MPTRPETLSSRLVLSLGVLLLAGCAAFGPRQPPLTTAQIVEMAKSGTAPAEIVRKLDETRTVLALSGSQYAKLRADGVPDEVLDHLQKRYVDAIEFDARVRYQSMYWGWGPPYIHRPFRAPFPYYYW